MQASGGRGRGSVLPAPRLSPEARRETQTDDEKVERGKTAPRHGTTDGLKREGAFAINMYMGRKEGRRNSVCCLTPTQSLWEDRLHYEGMEWEEATAVKSAYGINILPLEKSSL